MSSLLHTHSASPLCPRCGGAGRLADKKTPCPCTQQHTPARPPRPSIEGRNHEKLEAMVALSRLYPEMAIAKDLRSWRPLPAKRGSLRGIAEGLTPLCTDGVHLYCRRDDGSLLYGSLSSWEPNERPAQRGAAKPTRAELLFAELLSLLQ